MRYYTRKRARINRQAKKSRDLYLAENPWCQVLDCRERAVDVHEIARGVRVKAILERAAWLSVCRPHHDQMGQYSIWPPVRQLALKKLVDFEGYDRVAVNRLRGCAPESITEDEVDQELERLLITV